MKLSATIANSLWVASSLPAWRRFCVALKHPAEAQHHWLREHLARNADCEFARVHGLESVRSYEDFARRVPLADYEQHEPWVARIRQGESRLLTSEPVTHLIPTGGSTGARKLIPFTAGLQRDFNRAIGPWICDLAFQHPGLLGGPAYWSVTPAVAEAEAEISAVPVGFDDDASYLGGAQKWLVQAALVAPPELRLISDLMRFHYETLRCLVRHPDLRLISVWHPSFLSLLLDALPACWKKLIVDLRGNRELLRADPRKPETIWPHLKVISCWGDAHAEIGLADLRRRFPRTHVQPKGLLATEAFVTIPFDGYHLVAVCSHFFEFMDEGGTVHLVHELRQAQTYEVVVTTSGGLWRYRLGDRVQVDGFAGKTPSLRFVGRDSAVSDRCGEKLSEAFVAQVIRELARVSGSSPRYALLAPDTEANGVHYTLHWEGECPPGLAARVDESLRQNPNYAWCRAFGQLQTCRAFHIRAGGYKTFVAHEMKRGRRLGEIKPAALSCDTGWSQRFSGDALGR